MKAGDTFLRNDSDRHLWVVLSDPARDPSNVLLVNMTTLTGTKEKACILNAGDHPWITHETCINYADAIVGSLEKLLNAKDLGALAPQAPLDDAILRKIQIAAANSIHLEIEKFEILDNQGLCS